ncbi:hypothetical protein [Muricoccus vinaceus]|uniref:Uncharacterized protein n=1 Tax=Muricoccus vinaceus TaxID=424704 RepID=A0ABV6J3I9_9PROT
MEADFDQQNPSKANLADDALELVVGAAKYLADFARDRHLHEADALLMEILTLLLARKNGLSQ